MKVASRKPKSRRGERGFTLIEIILALAIAGFVLAALASAVHTLARSWEKNTQRVLRQDMVLRALAVLSRDVYGMQRLFFDGGDSAKFIFDGSSSQMQLVAEEPPYPSRPGLYFIRYRVVREGAGYALLRERAAFSPQFNGFSQITYGDGAILIEGRYRFNLSYGELARGELVWRDAWTDYTRLPRLVRLVVTDIATGKLIFARYVIRPRIDVEQDCVIPRALKCSMKVVNGKAGAKGNKKRLGQVSQ